MNLNPSKNSGVSKPGLNGPSLKTSKPPTDNAEYADHVSLIAIGYNSRMVFPLKVWPTKSNAKIFSHVSNASGKPSPLVSVSTSTPNARSILSFQPKTIPSANELKAIVPRRLTVSLMLSSVSVAAKSWKYG